MTNFLVDRLSDNSFVVREAAGETVGLFSELIGDDFLNKHKKIMPFLIKVAEDMLNSKQDMATQKTLFAMNEFINNIEYDIKFYLNDTINILLKFIQNNGQFSRDVLYWALFTMSNTINQAEKKITPFKDNLG